MNPNLRNKIHGITDEHVVEYKGGLKVAPDTLKHFLELQELAKKDGIQLEIVSGFRSFETQLAIWNRKASGEGPVYGEGDDVLNIDELSPEELMHAILRWSALPGASRHHWGTDIDIYDASKIQKEDLKLLVSEYEMGGPCGQLSLWMHSKMLSKECKFHLPYKEDLGGVGTEPWHFSYTEDSTELEHLISIFELRKVLAEQDIALKEVVLDNLNAIFDKYVLNVCAP
jgi:LAS superfamily LD-carboxypeptidase LdcB